MTKDEFIERVSYYLSDEFLEEKAKAAEGIFSVSSDWYAKVLASELIIDCLKEGIE